MWERETEQLKHSVLMGPTEDAVAQFWLCEPAAVRASRAALAASESAGDISHTVRAAGTTQAAAPINPSDLNFLLTKESYIQYPCTWGNEGSGWVVATGGGPGTEGLLGKAVGISGQRGTYAEYAVAPAYFVSELPQVREPRTASCPAPVAY